MKKYLFLLLVSINFIGNSQIIIDKTDMPVAGKYYTLSNSVSLNGIDYTQTGANFNWDFSSLKAINQSRDTFVNVSKTPAFYSIFFGLGKNKSSVAEPDKALTVDTIVSLKSVYNFFELTDTSFVQTGYGGTFNGMEIPLAFAKFDRIYKLPMEYGNKDSCISSFTESMSGIGYMSQIKHRKNTIDGWGTVKTPYGTFQALRVKTEITQKDSMKLDTLKMNLPSINSVYTEYKWLAKGFADPVLYITKDSILTKVNYIDSVRKFASIKKVFGAETVLKVFPNPATNVLNISYNLLKPSKVEITLTDILGKRVEKSCAQEAQQGILTFNLSKNKIHPGIYLLNIKTGRDNIVKKVVIY